MRTYRWVSGLPVTRAATVVFLILSLSCSPTPTSAGGDGGEAKAEDHALKYLALGDSYTIGESVEERMRFPVQLANLMRTRGARVAPPVIIARTGWTTGELAAALSEADLEGPFDLVTLLVGVNDQYTGRGVEEFRHELDKLLRSAIELAGGEPSRVIVISIPDWGTTPFASGRDRARIAEEIDQFNEVQRQVAESAGARWVDISDLSRKLSSHESMTASDGLHPSGMMYSEWARKILPHALDAVR